MAGSLAEWFNNDPRAHTAPYAGRRGCRHTHDSSLADTLPSPSSRAHATLSDFLPAELARLAARPTRDEMLTRIHSRKRVTLKTAAAVVIREERESA